MRAVPFWSNLIGYQLVWLVTVIGAGRGTAWPGIGVAIAFVLWQLLASQCRRGDARLLAVAVVLGTIIEGTLAGSGWASYAATEPALPMVATPVWILTLWMAFAMTLNHSLASFRGHLLLAAILGAAGAPLAYLGAQRAAHAITFLAPAWHGLAWLGTTWGLALPLLAALARRWSAASGSSSRTAWAIT